MHVWFAHLADKIRQFGVPEVADTNADERYHNAAHKRPTEKHSNHRDVPENAICRMRRFEVIDKLLGADAVRDAHETSPDENDGDDDDGKGYVARSPTFCISATR